MRTWPQQARTRSQDRPACLRLPDRATAPGWLKTTSRDAPAARPTCRRPFRLCCENIAETGGFLAADPPRAQEADKNGPRAAGHHLANHRCAGRKIDHLTGLGKG